MATDRNFANMLNEHIPRGKKVKQSPWQKMKVGKVMGEYKSGSLHSGSKSGPQVKSKKQAVAIAMSEAGMSKKKKKKKSY